LNAKNPAFRLGDPQKLLTLRNETIHDAHQPLDPTAAHPAALSHQLGKDARAAIASAGVATCLMSSTNSRLAADRRLSGRERQA
jgi:hypothetical protein